MSVCVWVYVCMYEYTPVLLPPPDDASVNDFFNAPVICGYVYICIHSLYVWGYLCVCMYT